jgi:hypothetical protein
LPDFGTQKVSKSALADFDWMRLCRPYKPEYNGGGLAAIFSERRPPTRA